MQAVARRVVDRWMLKLLKGWLKVTVEERGERGNRRMTGGKRSRRGTPQGGVISPLLANIYMNRFLRAWRERGKGVQYRARLIAYADDFVILSRGGDWVFEAHMLSSDCPGSLLGFVASPMLIEQGGTTIHGCRMGYLEFEGAVRVGGFTFDPRKSFSVRPPDRPLYDLVSTIEGHPPAAHA
jgi:hypothetical protein